MEQWYKAIIKIETEDDKGRVKYRKEPYLVQAVSPTDVEKKLADHIQMADYEVIAISLQNIVDVIK